MRSAKIEVEHVDYVPSKNAINQISDNSGVKQAFGSKPNPPVAENRLASPNEHRHYDYRKRRKRPHPALQHPPRASTVFDVSEVKNAGYHGNRRGSLKVPRGEFFYNRIRQRQIGDDGENRQKSPHCSPRSIALWHSIQVSTNG